MNSVIVLISEKFTSTYMALSIASIIAVILLHTQEIMTSTKY